MNTTSGLLTFILMAWMGASTYWYVCKIQKDCQKQEIKTSLVVLKDSEKTKDTPPPPPVEKEEKKEVVAKKVVEKKIKDPLIALKAKLTKGYIIHDFPKGSNTHNNVESEFDAFAKNLKVYLAKNSQQKIVLTGHTDNSGSEQTNLFYGKKRALFVQKKLMAIGIAKTHFIIKTMGEKDPVASNDTKIGQNKNRRVVIELSK